MYPFQEIPLIYSSQLKKVNDQYISKLYSNFVFSYYNYNEKNNDQADEYIVKFLQQYALVIYQISNLNNNNSTNQNNDNLNFLNLIVCVEKQCLIIESINFNVLETILHKVKSSFINISFNCKIPQTNNDRIALDEVISFRNFFQAELKNNFFIKYTIDPLISFIIRRHFYPTSFFQDKTFFIFNNKTTSRAQSSDIFSVSQQSEIDTENNNQIEMFKEKDFIKLRPFNSGSSSIFYLVLHLESFYVFVMKMYVNDNSEKSYCHEVEFCSKYSHICLTSFYGFISSNGKDIKGFVYEFMNNGSLFNFMSLNPLNELFRMKTIFCVFQAISYLHSNNLIHRDIKPSNILIDHDEIPHLSDYDQIRSIEIKQGEQMTQNIGAYLYASPEQINGSELISFATDIYSFGRLIYYLYENSENESKEIKYLYENCCQADSKNRLKIEEIKSLIYFLVGKMFYEGKIIDKNYIKSKEFFEISASGKNNTDSLYYLGKQYKEGQGVEKDYSKAKSYFELSLKQDNNNSKALYEYGMLYYEGRGVNQDIEKAKQCFELSAKQNNSDALYNLGRLYDQGLGVDKSYQEALKYYELSANMNNPDAINRLGYLYYKGQGVQQDYKKCKEYIERAAKLDNDFAINNLGYLYYEGIVVQRDYSKARQYFELAAKKFKLPIAYYNLAKIYYYGYDVPVDFPLAKQYFQYAADGNHSDANIFLGKMYKKGKGCQQNYEKAIDLFQISAQNNNSDALFILGKMFLKGKGVKQNYLKAKEYFEKSSQKDNLDALFNLAKMYYEGKGVEQDYIKAKDYFELCSSKKNLDSYFFLGLMYENGEGVERDLSKSIHYYSKCAEIHDQNVIFSYDNDTCSYGKKRINEHYYRSNNDLALIYFTEPEFKNIELAEEYLKNAALNEYPFGQNNYGTFFLYYQKHLGNAMHMFERASKNKFALAEFNLGHICEQEHKLDEALSHYLKAIEYENAPFQFKRKLIEDERLEISKTLIISFVNLKLSLYIEQSSKEFIVNALFTPLFKLLIHSKNHSYCFTFTENKNFVQNFLLSFPLFQISTDTNSDGFGWTENMQSSNSISIIIQNKNQSNDKNNKNIKEVKYFEIKKCQKNEIKSEIDKILNKLDLESKFKIIKNEQLTEIKFIDIKDSFERKLVIPDNFADILFSNMNETKEQIKDTIMKLSQIIFIEPFSILFGRINIYKSDKKVESKEINTSFYEGFENEA